MHGSKLARISCTLAGAFLALPAKAILIRADYDSPGTTNYQRYLNLANQDRFDTVGSLNFFTIGTSASSLPNSCTGTLISANVILTAAHCFDAGSASVRSFNYTSSLSTMSLATGGQVFFSGGANVGTDATHPTKNVSFSAQVDRLSIYPGYSLGSSSITFGGDLALLRVYGTPWIGSLPTNYIPLNLNTSEPFPSPALGITIGYGRTGNGLVGQVPMSNAAGEKRAGLTVVDFDFLHPSTLRSTFNSPSVNQRLLLPSNFLQAAPGSGDSGGPLIMNFGAGDTIAGIVQGGGNTYGSNNWWTRVSSFADWITAEAAKLGSAPITSLPGSSASSPLLPVLIRDIGTTISEKSFRFYGGAAGFPVFLDPEGSDAIEIYVDNGPDIASVLVPTGFGTANVSLWDASLGKFVDSGLSMHEGAWFEFADGVESFRLTGMTEDVDAVSLGFQFSEAGEVDLRWRSVTPVPEPGTGILALLGLLALVPRVRTRSTQKRTSSSQNRLREHYV